MTTGDETGSCRPENEGWDEKSPFARSHVLTPSRLVGKGNLPPSHPVLLGVGGEVGSAWVVEVEGDDNGGGVFPGLNLWKRRVSEAWCDNFRSRVASGEAWGVREDAEPELMAENSSREGGDAISGEDALSDSPPLRVRRSSSSFFTPGKMPGKGNNFASPPYFCKASLDAGGTGDTPLGELGKYVVGSGNNRIR
jgi:hypothetical protein